MKHKGSITQTYLDRDRMAEVLFRQAKHLAEWPTNTMRLCEIAASLPVDEFYLSEENAVAYIRRRINHGIRKTFTNKYKQQLYEAFYERVMELRDLEKFRDASIPVLVSAALATPAPCIGLRPINLYVIINRRKRIKKK